MGSQHRVCAVSWIIHHGEVPGQLGEEVDGTGLAEQLLPRLETEWENVLTSCVGDVEQRVT